MSSIARSLIDLAKACNRSFGVPSRDRLLAGFASPLVGILGSTFPTLMNSLYDWESKR